MRKQLLTIVLGALACMTPKHASAQEFFAGGDISVLQSYEDNNVSYYDQQGAKIDDVLKYMKSDAVGWNAQRVRLFVAPERKAPDGSTDAQVCQDLDYVVRLCQRIKEEGFALMLDFHYSDTWADPANQWTPKDWQSLNDEELKTRIYEYTRDCLQKLVEAEAEPDFIQTGNEISYGMLWGSYGSKQNRCYTSSDAGWTRFTALLQQAVKACREVCPQAKIIIHTERAGQPDVLTGIYQRLASVDFDIIGLSYYPFWHGSLTTLSNTLDQLSKSFPDKMVQIVETAYYYQWQPAQSSTFTDFSNTWSVSADGQAAFLRALIAELKRHDNVNGLYWWFPEENGNGPGSSVLTNWVNRGLWNNNSHRAHSGLYVLKEFLNRPGTGVYAIKRRIDDGWYNLSGMRLDSRPQRHGLYIVSGRKVAVH